ncbi:MULTISPECIES: hypothetical protein [Comamonas]|jgi:hypothetical protein|uniref:Uncharacterized protein n=3 Tax=Comamonas TaxID=283 RepID=A0A076PQJ2_COMTE|nr:MULTISPECIES: hypothetical protein [Comamonas]AIJ46996.1 hypothetical protein O987_14400 [Comamonas testosteroni TK102]KGH04167.1 hypothetical protein P365_13835 [Comamonas thiooxydans]KGH12471.1 hypothetical protein P368_11660 [Comamonas thiooxydans]MPS89496.1 hypothetical protein [Comamonas sp.]TYK69988.1 hypothetical protein FSY59_16920 [Comamonas sp. Z3]
MKIKADTSTFVPSAVLRYETWLGYQEEMGLPLTAENYQVTQLDNDRWSVTDIAGTQVYLGIGPVEIAGA